MKMKNISKHTSYIYMDFDLVIISNNGEKIDYDEYWNYNSKLFDFFYKKMCFGLFVCGV